jgi:ribosomal protein L21E
MEVIGHKKGEGVDVTISPTRHHPDPHPFFMPDNLH